MISINIRVIWRVLDADAADHVPWTSNVCGAVQSMLAKDPVIVPWLKMVDDVNPGVGFPNASVAATPPALPDAPMAPT